MSFKRESFIANIGCYYSTYVTKLGYKNKASIHHRNKNT